MNTRRQAKSIGVILAVGLIVGAGVAQAATRGYYDSPRHRRAGPSNFEFVLEGGLAAPAGDVSDPLEFAGVGKDAGTGYELGFRVRQFMNGGMLAISPAFHYVEFGKTSGVGDFELQLGPVYDEPYEVKTSLMRYGVDFQYFLNPGRARQVGMYLSAGPALIHNRYHDVIAPSLPDGGPYDTSENTLGLSLGAGVRAGSFEMSAAYTFNRFSSDQMTSQAGVDYDFNWDYLSVRFGLAFGAH